MKTNPSQPNPISAKSAPLMANSNLQDNLRQLLSTLVRN
jgi:hypothetical protein